jgi:hypothetical protein
MKLRNNSPPNRPTDAAFDMVLKAPNRIKLNSGASVRRVGRKGNSMQMQNVNDELTAGGTTVNDLTVSGKFLAMAANGSLMVVGPLILERAKITEEIRMVEQRLHSCHHPQAVAGLAEWCVERNKDFDTEFRSLVDSLETQKRKLTVALQEIDEKLAPYNVVSDWRMDPDVVSLLPPSRSDPVVASRSMIIFQNREKPDLQICRILDSPWRNGEPPERFFPPGWREKYGVTGFVAAYYRPECRNLVHTMISKGRKRGP